MIIGTFIPQ